MRIRVLLADDHVLFRQGLRRLLEMEEDIEIVGEACNGLEAEQLARDIHPDVILMDYSMPVVDGATATKHILDENRRSKIIILTMHQQDQSAFEAIRAGAQGYLLKDSAIEDVLRAIRAVQEGKSLIDPTMATRILLEFRRMAEKDEEEQNCGNLTAKEIDILKFVAMGMTNKEIAAKLCLSEKTIKNCLTLVFQKLQINDRVQAAVYAIQQGLIS